MTLLTDPERTLLFHNEGIGVPSQGEMTHRHLVTPLVLVLLIGCATAPHAPEAAVAEVQIVETASEAAPLFLFTTDGFWLGLHHFLYVLGRAEAGMSDASRRAVVGAPEDARRGVAELSAEERATWAEAVAAYAAGPSQLDAVFDQEMVAATRSLAAADSLDEVELEPAWEEALQEAAPIYRLVWWPEHEAANLAWVGAIEPLLAAHGEAVLDFLTRAYGEAWPEVGYPVQLSPYTNWAGAYSTDGPLLVISSLDADLHGTMDGLETLFHEAAHQWDEPLSDRLIAAATAEEMRFGRGLGHAILFFTAGEAVRSVVPEHVPYARSHGLWERQPGVFLAAIEAGWAPYLSGPDLGDEAAREAALRALMRALAAETPAD